MNLRHHPLLGIALGLLVGACSGSSDDVAPPTETPTSDAGSDATPNDETDAGTDSGIDADTDSGTDADTDSGTDANPGETACIPDCEAGQRCEHKVCICDADSCEAGCCTAEGVCETGDTMLACGQGGALCDVCDETKANACGESGACECNDGPACAVGECMGALGCVDLQTDPNNCGVLSHDCLGAPCVEGLCQLTWVTVSQMSDNSPGEEGVSCTNQGENFTKDNSWWRRFYFEEHAEVGMVVRVKSVTISTGDREVSGGLPSVINLYSLRHSAPVDTIPTNELSLIGTADFTATGSLVSITVPVTGVIADTAANDLVVEWHTDGSAPGQGIFFPGATDKPGTHPSFISTVECGIGEPATMASIGFPNAHLTMVVELETVPSSDP